MVSVTLRFADSDAQNAFRLRIGEVAEVVKQVVSLEKQSG
jgi:hypothetical protein